MPLLLAQKENRKKGTFWVANTIEKGLLIFGREYMGERKKDESLVCSDFLLIEEAFIEK